MTKIAGSGSRIRIRIHEPEAWIRESGSGDPDPDPHQNVMDPEHCYKISIIFKWSLTRELVYSEMVQGQLPHRILFEFKTEGVRAPIYPK
jgi:hypothetical protein